MSYTNLKNDMKKMDRPLGKKVSNDKVKKVLTEGLLNKRLNGLKTYLEEKNYYKKNNYGGFTPNIRINVDVDSYNWGQQWMWFVDEGVILETIMERMFEWDNIYFTTEELIKGWNSYKHLHHSHKVIDYKLKKIKSKTGKQIREMLTDDTCTDFRQFLKDTYLETIDFSDKEIKEIEDLKKKEKLLLEEQSELGEKKSEIETELQHIRHRLYEFNGYNT